jgi:hypothetical protein
MNPPDKPAQVAFTTSIFTSPEVLGGLATMISLALNKAFGVQIFSDPQYQQALILLMGAILTGLAHWLFPGASGKLGFTAPAAWNVPSPQPVASGPNIITVPAPTDEKQTTGVLPLPPGAHKVEVTAPTPSPAVPVVPPPLPPTVVVTPAA